MLSKYCVKVPHEDVVGPLESNTKPLNICDANEQEKLRKVVLLLEGVFHWVV